MKHYSSPLVLCLPILLSTMAQAGNWQVGFVSENARSPFAGDKTEINTMPAVNYIGENFSFINGDLEYKFDRAGSIQAYLVGKVRQPQFYTLGEGKVMEGMQERDQALELGLGTKFITPAGQFVLEGLTDTNDTHRGYELNAQYSYPKQSRRWWIEPGIVVRLQSDDLVDYYHGVTTQQVTADRPAYRGREAVNTIASLMLAYQIDARLALLGGFEMIWLDKAISDSPLVSEKTSQKVFAGLIYTF